MGKITKAEIEKRFDETLKKFCDIIVYALNLLSMLDIDIDTAIKENIIDGVLKRDWNKNRNDGSENG